MQGGTLRDGQYEVQTATMLDLTRAAYGLDADKILGAPAWFATDRFDVTAKAPASASFDTVRLMLRTLLADRFKLIAHSDTQRTQAFVLSMGPDKPNLKEATGQGRRGCQLQPLPPPVPGMVFDNIYSCHNMTMDTLAATLPGLARAYLPSPVVNSTGLKGNWDFDIKWTSKNSLRLTGDKGVTVFDAVGKQLGLQLGMQTTPVPVLVIDHAEKPIAK
jgi:uncharacterized protein (TIGR03435 family)